jgi:D-hydroxyproline dehydrogenase subunit gamma
MKITLNGREVQVSEGITVAAALSIHLSGITRRSVSGEARAPLCGMGICQECAVSINGQRRLACQTLVREGLVVASGDAQE